MGFCPVAVSDLLALRAEGLGARTAYTFESGDDRDQVDYATLSGRVYSTATRLVEVCPSGSRVLVALDPGLDNVVALLACSVADCTAVPLPPPRSQLERRRFAAVARDAAAAAAFVEERDGVRPENQAILGALPRVESSRDCAKSPDFARAPDGDSLALIQYTSGSTGAPKGVCIRHRQLLANLASLVWAADRTPPNTDPAWAEEPHEHSETAFWLPPYHDMGLIGGIYAPLYSGRPVSLMSPLRFLQQPSRWLDLLSRSGARVTAAPTFAYQLCVDRVREDQIARLDLSRWRVAVVSAEPVREATLRAFADKFEACGFDARAFVPAYGLAEATLVVSAAAPDCAATSVILDRTALLDGRAEECSAGRRGRSFVGSGEVAPGTQVAIVDVATERRLPDGAIGEIWVTGPSISRAYWNDAEMSAEVLGASIADASEAPDVRWLRTGDLGFMRRGELFVTGRSKDAIVIRGRNVAPQDLEGAVAASHPALRADSIAAVAHEDAGIERVAIVAAASPTVRGSLSELVGAVRAAAMRGADCDVHTVAFVRPADFPKTTSGKVRRQEIRRLLAADELPLLALWQGPAGASAWATSLLSRESLPEASELEAWLQAVIAELVGTSPASIRRDQPLSEFGLDSVRAAFLAERLESLSGRPLPSTLVFAHPTVLRLTAALTGEESPGVEAEASTRAAQRRRRLSAMAERRSAARGVG